MKASIACEYNMDTGCLEIRTPDDGSVVGIDCTAVENSIAEDRFNRSDGVPKGNVPRAAVFIRRNAPPATSPETLPRTQEKRPFLSNLNLVKK